VGEPRGELHFSFEAAQLGVTGLLGSQ